MSVWLFYRRTLAIGTVVVFFTAASDYAYVSGLAAVPPLYWILAFAGLALPLLLTPNTLSFVGDSRLTRWSGMYAGFTIMAFMWSSQSATAWGEVRLRMLAVLFLGTMLVIVADTRVHQVLRVTVLCSVILSVVLNVVDLARPLTFSSTLGRSAGFYVNPNISAVALVLGMILSVDLLPRGARPWFVCFVGGGVLLTFSRGGAVTWLIATALVVGLGGISLVSFLRVALVSALVAVGILVVAGWWHDAVQMASFMTSGAWEKLRLGTDVMDASAEARLGDAGHAWQMFIDRPLMGWGVGATSEWDWFESTHNMYLRHLAEYGVAGVAIIPLLVWGLMRDSGVRSRIPVWVGAVVLIWSMFSHNVLDERHFLISIALAGALAKGRDTGELVSRGAKSGRTHPTARAANP